MGKLRLEEMNALQKSKDMMSHFTLQTFQKDLLLNLDFDTMGVEEIQKKWAEAAEYLNHIPWFYGLWVLSMIQQIQKLEEDNVYADFGKKNTYFNFVKHKKEFIDARSPGKISEWDLIFVRETVFDMLSKMQLPQGITLKITRYQQLQGKIGVSPLGDLVIDADKLFDYEEGLPYCIGWKINIFELHLPLFILEKGKKVHLDQLTLTLWMIDGDPEFEVESIDGTSIVLKEVKKWGEDIQFRGPADAVCRE